MVHGVNHSVETEGRELALGSSRTEEPCLGQMLRLRPIAGGMEGAAVPGTAGTRMFGGALLAQCVLAGAQGAPAGQSVHAVHAQYVRPGPVVEPVRYACAVLRKSRTFTTSDVVGRVAGETVVTAVVSLHEPVPSGAHDTQAPVPAEDPHSCAEATGGALPPPRSLIRGPFDIRFAGARRTDEFERPVLGLWVRCRRSGLGSHESAAALAWLTDFALTHVADLEHARGRGARRAASLDHALWIHHPPDLDAWHYYELTSPSYSGSLAFSLGRIFDRAGQLRATVAQESILRRRS